MSSTAEQTTPQTERRSYEQEGKVVELYSPRKVVESFFHKHGDLFLDFEELRALIPLSHEGGSKRDHLKQALLRYYSEIKSAAVDDKEANTIILESVLKLYEILQLTIPDKDKRISIAEKIQETFQLQKNEQAFLAELQKDQDELQQKIEASFETDLENVKTAVKKVITLIDYLDETSAQEEKETILEKSKEIYSALQEPEYKDNPHILATFESKVSEAWTNYFKRDEAAALAKIEEMFEQDLEKINNAISDVLNSISQLDETSTYSEKLSIIELTSEIYTALDEPGYSDYPEEREKVEAKINDAWRDYYNRVDEWELENIKEGYEKDFQKIIVESKEAIALIKKLKKNPSEKEQVDIQEKIEQIYSSLKKPIYYDNEHVFKEIAYRVNQAWINNPLITAEISDEFLLTGVLGQGGGGKAFSAKRYGKEVADDDQDIVVKILQPRNAEGDKEVDRDDYEDFQHEISILKQVEGNEVLQYVDGGALAIGARETKDAEVAFSYGAWVAVKAFDGKPFEESVKSKEKMPLDLALEAVAGVAKGLDEIHQQGLVHRDIKPDNILVRQEEDGVHVQLIDFGIAALQNEYNESPSENAQKISGTPMYISPEQMIGEKISGKADVFSLGIILHQALTKKHPFGTSDQLKTALSTMTSILNNPSYEAAEIRSDIPVEVQNLLTRMLNKEPDQRPTAHEVWIELNDIILNRKINQQREEFDELFSEETEEIEQEVERATIDAQSQEYPVAKAYIALDGALRSRRSKVIRTKELVQELKADGILLTRSQQAKLIAFMIKKKKIKLRSGWLNVGRLNKFWDILV